MKSQINLNDLLTNFSELESVKEELKSTISENISARNNKIIVVFDNEKFSWTYGYLLINLFYLEFCSMYKIPVTKDDLFLDEFYTSKHTPVMLDKLLDKCEEYNIDLKEYEDFVYNKILNELSDFADSVPSKIGVELALDDFLVMLDEPELKDVFDVKIPYGTTYDEVETIFKNNTAKLNNYYHTHKNAGLSPFVTADDGINMKQLTQCMSFVGLKPDIDDKTIPVPVTENYLEGLTNLEYLYIDAKGTRKALIVNYIMVRKAGYLSRKLDLLNSDTLLDDIVEDCHTKHFITYNVDNENKLKLIEGRHYYEFKEDGTADYDNLKTVKLSDKFLIGKKIALRDPSTCACHNGKICKTCYGKRLAEINKNKHIGLLASKTLTEPLTQLLLSAKHLLQTNNEKINWPEYIVNNFTVDMNLIFFSNENLSVEIPDICYENFDEEENAYVINRCIIKSNDETESDFEFLSPVTLYINPDFNAKILKDVSKNKVCNLTINFEDLDTSKYLFKFEDHNRAISKSLKSILDLLETTNHLNINNTNDFVNKFYDLIIENNMVGNILQGVHLSVITKNLILDMNDKPIDWSQDEIPEYKIVRVSKGVLSGPISKSLVFERIRDQISNPETYEKDEDSIYNLVFK